MVKSITKSSFVPSSVLEKLTGPSKVLNNWRGDDYLYEERNILFYIKL